VSNDGLEVETTTSSATSLTGRSSGLGGTGVWGIANGLTGWAVWGMTDSGLGVRGEADTGTGTYGRTAATGGAVAGVAGEATAATGSVAGVWGFAKSPTGIGVYGETTDTGTGENYGVAGISRSSLGRGVFGWNQSALGGRGVWGQTNPPLGAGVRGYAWDGNPATGKFGTGVIGTSGSDAFPPPAAKADTGVYGYSAHNASSRGVWGQSGSGQGVRGQATSGAGLYGTATTGYALQTSGRVKLDKSAGKATIASGQSSVVVTPGIDLTSSSAVVATLNGNAGGSTTVKRVAIDATANTFTIFLTVAATASVSVAWIVLG